MTETDEFLAQGHNASFFNDLKEAEKCTKENMKS